MIGRLQGTLIEKQAPEVLIDCGGVGYEVQLPMTSFYQLPEVGQPCTLVTHFVVREDAQLLYGFATRAERALFRELIKTNGIGPKMALAILSGMSAEQFVAAVQREDITGITKVPGVGKKTAERLVVEMRDRMKGFVASLATPNADAFALDNPVENTFITAPDASEDAIAALEALGYKATVAKKAVEKVRAPGATSEQLIKDALKAMM
ncbi:Holliday junction branch migration protein RuvA [Ferrimonas sediminicola]|uniref:Holliday junction branch migration complex subunit RuvA n=1 Tax=Ferrimonas sediminicola TaxID=2569538 RepID=A0A4U1BHN5_9GAMM|nr:Holliday junction branch migration protein RuvA [Ferrimonas sediminicola]TKB50567.1 Holliday junction branch migration protein RuvA [Ferrimonas sediminicola]